MLKNLHMCVYMHVYPVDTYVYYMYVFPHTYMYIYIYVHMYASIHSHRENQKGSMLMRLPWRRVTRKLKQSGLTKRKMP